MAQETGIFDQLKWAINEASKLGLNLSGTREDLEHMERRKLSTYKDLYLDSGVTGADMNRPGLLAFIRTAVDDTTVSHVLVHMPDRLARPEEPSMAMTIERQLGEAGVTIVFSSRTVAPRRRGESNVVADITALVAYDETGQFLNRLASRIVQAKTSRAARGYWTGGPPPYGFARFRLRADGTSVQLAPGESLKQVGSHTEIRPVDPEKIAVWLIILKWYQEQGWGIGRIAKELNTMGIPSPSAGTKRANAAKFSRLWRPGAVARLIGNKAIAAVQEFGKTSSGAHRRLGTDGAPRLLEDADRRHDGQPRQIANAADLVIVSDLPGFEPCAPLATVVHCQNILADRGRSQRGVPKAKDPAKFPLAGRILDRACGGIMYGESQNQHRLYLCSTYRNSSGRECAYNTVDAEGLLSLLLRTFAELIGRSGSAASLRQKLRVLAEKARIAASARGAELDERGLLETQLKGKLDELALAKQNLPRAKTADDFEVVSVCIAARKLEIAKLERRLLGFRSPALDESLDADVEIEAAMGVLDRLSEVANDPQSRREVHRLVRKIDLKILLNFEERLKKTRKVRKLVGGIITIGAGTDQLIANSEGCVAVLPSNDAPQSPKRESTTLAVRRADGPTASPASCKNNRLQSTEKLGKLPASIPATEVSREMSLVQRPVISLEMDSGGILRSTSG